MDTVTARRRARLALAAHATTADELTDWLAMFDLHPGSDRGYALGAPDAPEAPDSPDAGAPTGPDASER
ncbi:hypothetical protein ABT160_40755 [Streptomyces sp. NPDC001941]|uniref:hypothetical protein n=1 Tax=Streptomyces sp. NPDC001941 TaxID=3154659 RepID=UPI003327614D